MILFYNSCLPKNFMEYMKVLNALWEYPWGNMTAESDSDKGLGLVLPFFRQGRTVLVNWEMLWFLWNLPFVHKISRIILWWYALFDQKYLDPSKWSSFYFTHIELSLKRNWCCRSRRRRWNADMKFTYVPINFYHDSELLIQKESVEDHSILRFARGGGGGGWVVLHPIHRIPRIIEFL